MLPEDSITNSQIASYLDTEQIVRPIELVEHQADDHLNGRPMSFSQDKGAKMLALVGACCLLAICNYPSPAGSWQHNYHINRRLARGAAQDASQQTIEQELPVQAATGGSCLPTAELKAQTTDSYFQTSGFTEPQVSSFVRPTFYTLRLKVDPTKPKFAGQLMITLNVDDLPVSSSSGQSAQAQTLAPARSVNQKSAASPKQPADEAQLPGYRYLTLHAGGNLNVKRAFYVYSSRGGVQIPASKLGRDPVNELLTIDFHPNVITPGQGLLLIVYNGLVNDTESHGLFVHRSHKPRSRSSAAPAEDPGLATHMQPSFSRRLFPAWDAPHLKARFNLIVVLPFRSYQTLSNMPVRRKSFSLSCSGEPIQEVEFHTTPTMSTYLLTLVIGHFDFLEAQTPNNCLVRLYVYANQSAPEQSEPPTTTPEPESEVPKLQSINRPLTRERIDSSSSSGYSQVNNKRSAAALGLDAAVKVIDKMETLLGVKYPLSKFDMIALRDFNSGGMENWGISIFHENYLLSDSQQQPQSTPTSSLMAAIASANQQTNASSQTIKVAPNGTIPASSQLSADIQVNGGRNRPRRVVVPLVVAHEVAHQWFGNLVTAKSWTYLWLNEGFAQMLMYELADRLFPHLDYWHMFMEDTRQSAMREDEMLTSSHTLEVGEEPANNDLTDGVAPELQANDAPPTQRKPKTQLSSSTSTQLSLFDEITYNKGALVAKTVYHLLGREQFFSGLKHYLLKHSYESVNSHDLWLALEEAGGLPDGQLDSMMQSWLKLEGFPLVSVAVDEEPNAWVLHLQQNRFSLLPLELLANRSKADESQQHSSSSSSADECCWSLPVCVSSQLRPNPVDAQLQLLGPARRTIPHDRKGGRQPRQPGPINAAGVCFLFSERYATISIPKSATGAWFKLNFNATGLYRVDYQLPAGRWELSTGAGPIVMANGSQQNGANQTPSDSHNHHGYNSSHHHANYKQPTDVMSKMGAAVRDKTMCVIDRLNLADDLFAMVKSGRKPTSYYLDFIVANYELEHEPIVLRLIVNSMKRIRVAIMSNGPKRPLLLYDRYVQKFLRKLTRSVNRAKEELISELAMATAATGSRQAADGINQQDEQQQQQQQEFRSQLQLQLPKLHQNINQLNEIEELIESSRVTFEDGDFLKTAVRLFNQNFRLPSPGASVFDTMDRETRAAIYTGALLGAPNQQDLPLDVTLRAHEGEWLVQSKLLRKNSTHNLEKTLEALRAIDTTDVFMKLLRAYELSDSSAERFAISSALGSVREPNKRAHLLDLTINYYYFRSHDLYNVLEAMARTRSGRQLIWSKIRPNEAAISGRGLLPAILRSLQSGFMDRAGLSPSDRDTGYDNGFDGIRIGGSAGSVNNDFDSGGDNNERRKSGTSDDRASRDLSDSIDEQLRDLYHYYGDQMGEIISKTNEFILINTRWFNRDYTKLVQFLETKEG